MNNETKQFFEDFKVDLAKMKDLIPDAVGGFSGIFSKIMKDGALSTKEKELVALGIGVVQRCAPCIKLHVKNALMSVQQKSRFSKLLRSQL